MNENHAQLLSLVKGLCFFKLNYQKKRNNCIPMALSSYGVVVVKVQGCFDLRETPNPYSNLGLRISFSFFFFVIRGCWWSSMKFDDLRKRKRDRESQKPKGKKLNRNTTAAAIPSTNTKKIKKSRRKINFGYLYATIQEWERRLTWWE